MKQNINKLFLHRRSKQGIAQRIGKQTYILNNDIVSSVTSERITTNGDARADTP